MSNVFTLQRQTDWPVFIINTTGSHYRNILSSQFDLLSPTRVWMCPPRSLPAKRFMVFRDRKGHLFMNDDTLQAYCNYSTLLGFSLWWRFALGRSVCVCVCVCESRIVEKMLLIVVLQAVIHKKIGELWATKWDGFACFSSSVRGHAVYHVRTFLESIYRTSAVHGNHENKSAL